MEIIAKPDQADAAASGADGTVKVWDLFVRIFHWSLVVLFVAAFLSGDESDRIHLTAGYAIAGLVAMRIVWGFIGSKYARFSDFVKGPGEVWRFLMLSMRLKAPRVIGHNPAGGAMIIALLAMLVGLSVTGFLMTTDAFWDSKAMEEAHEILAYVTLGLVVLHIAGVIVAGIEHGENLARSMVTGRKRAS